jgi:arylsulfatase A-like enzyme
MSKRPNILLIHSDQHRHDCLGAHGHPLLKTPNLDRLAREGTDFSHAFSTIPICSPARASLLTGAWPPTHGVLCIPETESYRPARRELPVITNLMAQNGYSIGWVGKFHNEVEGYPTDWGVEEFVGSGGYKKWRQEQNLPPEPVGKGFFGEIDEVILPEQSALHWQTDQVLEMLDARIGGEKPWFVRFDPSEPHLPCRPSRAFADLYDASEIAPWASFPDSLEGKPRAQKFYRDSWGCGDWSWEQWQPIVRNYLSVIAELDAQIGRILALLEARGELDSTLILYSTDHGDYCGGHGCLDKHFALYDDLVRVPLLVRWPENVPQDLVCEEFCSQEIDLARTILAAAQIEAPESFVGHNLIELANGKAGRSDIYTQYFGTHVGLYSSRMVRERRWKYVFNPTGGDELYDLENDEGELRNLADNADFAEEKRRMKRRLWEWMG